MTKGLFDTALRGQGSSAHIAWFFKGNQYIRFNMNTRLAEQAPKPIVGNWGKFNTWPGEFADGIDAVLPGSGAFEGKVWFFRRNKYLRYHLANDIVEDGPFTIAGHWGQNTWPASFANGIDAVLQGLGQFQGKVWFFKGRRYIRYDVDQDLVESDPNNLIRDFWGNGGWPAAFDEGVDLALYGPDNDTVFFFRGDKYITYKMSTDTVVSGPTPIKDDWLSLFQQLYSADVNWGVDSLNPSSLLLGNQTLFEYVREKCGVQPQFWGRYLDALTPQEANFILQSGCKILPIYRGATPTTIAGGFQAGVNDANNAITRANTLGVPAGVAIYADIEPAWMPSRDWFIGWWITFAFSNFNEGIYFNSQAVSPFDQPYRDAFALRSTITSHPLVAILPQVLGLPPGTNPLRDTSLWAQFPQVPAFADFRGCPSAAEAMLKSFSPGLHSSNPAGVVIWQFKINCLPFPLLGALSDPVPLNTGNIDHNLAKARGLSMMWG